jgi:protein-disulfide isomerase
MSRKTWIILAVLVALVAGGGAWYALSDGEMGGVSEAVAASPNYSPLPTDHVAGNPKAKVTLIEYASPTCPVCATFMINYYPRLKRDYIDTGKIFYVYRVFLRLADDGAAEKLARCLPKDKYMAFHDTLYRNQAKWDYEFGIPQPEGVRAALIELAGGAGLSPAAAEQCLASTKDEAAISKVGEDGVTRYNVAATPTLVINGEAKAGFENFFQRLDAALAK